MSKARRKRSVLITGCGSGIGHLAAHSLQARGWQVIASARKAEDVERLKWEGLNAVLLDLTEPESIAMALDWTLRHTGGKLDALINNGAFAVFGAVEDLSRRALAEQLDVGLLGWHDLTTRVLPYMRRQGGGRIVQLSSVLGVVGMPYRGAYCATKFALEGLSDVLRLELADSGIHVSLIEPAAVKTPFRLNAHSVFKRFVSNEPSLHINAYIQLTRRLESQKTEPFMLKPEAVVSAIVHALETKRPKPRYTVGKGSWLMSMAKRVLPNRCLDKLLLWVAKREQKQYLEK